MSLRGPKEALVATWLVALFSLSAHGQEESRLSRILIESTTTSTLALKSLPLVLTRELSIDARAPAVGPIRWLKLNGESIAPGSSAPPGGIRLQGVRPGSYTLPLRAAPYQMTVVRVGAFSSTGDSLSRASPARSVPADLAFGGESNEEEELIRFLVAGNAHSLPAQATVVSLGADGTYADSLRKVPLVSVECPGELLKKGEELACVGTLPLRLVPDLAERSHPNILGRALLGEIGGQLLLKLGGAQAISLPVLAPARLVSDGPGRYRVRLRATVVRTFKGGPPAVGDDDEEARAIVQGEIASASRMWGQCGISLGRAGEVEVKVVDPPTISMITVGCGRGLPASGGTIRFAAGNRAIFLRTHEGESPSLVAVRLAAAIRQAGLSVKLLSNTRAGDAALPSYDLVLTDGHGQPSNLAFPAGGPSDDRSLRVCVARLDLADGLEHFSDLDAATGTTEERYLLRALSDDDPQTIELFVVPLFSGMGRIGESFIYTQGGSVESALILDRTGVRAGARSFTLAHELGHILLDLPGHPDDFGVDTPSSLMDADAADSTIFGPRRLSLDDCRRALRQSGAGAPVPLISDWPLESASPQTE